MRILKYKTNMRDNTDFYNILYMKLKLKFMKYLILTHKILSRRTTIFKLKEPEPGCFDLSLLLIKRIVTV